VPYAQISARLGIPVGSIGPNRGRCPEKLRRHLAIVALINTETPTTGSRWHTSPGAAGRRATQRTTTRG
jgi:hypothetical protein